MARGDVGVFGQALLDLHNGVFNLDGDTINLGIVDNTTTPTASTAAPHWGGTGTTDFATNEVSTAGGYTGPTDVAGATSGATGTVTFDLATNPTFSQNASGATDCYWGILYDNTDANKRCIGWVDLGGPVSIAAGDVTITWNASGFWTNS